MTRENLGDHLSWLLRTQPGRPTSIGSLSTLLDSSLAQSEAYEGGELHIPPLDMARLRAIPSTPNPKLVSEARCSHPVNQDAARPQLLPNVRQRLISRDVDTLGGSAAGRYRPPLQPAPSEPPEGAGSGPGALISSSNNAQFRKTTISTQILDAQAERNRQERPRANTKASISPRDDDSVHSITGEPGHLNFGSPREAEYMPDANIESIDLTEHGKGTRPRKRRSAVMMGQDENSSPVSRKILRLDRISNNGDGVSINPRGPEGRPASSSPRTLPAGAVQSQSRSQAARPQSGSKELQWTARMSPGRALDDGNELSDAMHHGSGFLAQDESRTIARLSPPRYAGMTQTVPAPERRSTFDCGRSDLTIGTPRSTDRLVPPVGVSGHDRIDDESLALLKEQFSDIKARLIQLLHNDEDLPDSLLEERLRLRGRISHLNQIQELQSSLQDSRRLHAHLGERVLTIFDDGGDHGPLREERRAVETLIEEQEEKLRAIIAQGSDGRAMIQRERSFDERNERVHESSAFPVVQQPESGFTVRTHTSSDPTARSAIIYQTPASCYQPPPGRAHPATRSALNPAAEGGKTPLRAVNGRARELSSGADRIRMGASPGHDYSFDSYAFDEDDFDFPSNAHSAGGADTDPTEQTFGRQSPGYHASEGMRRTESAGSDTRAERLVLGSISGNAGRKPSQSTPKSKPKPSELCDVRALMKYKWSPDVENTLKRRFHLRGFRHNQLEAINATLGGKDTFVLMPTGGGKSLCYQLPSIISTGNTRGVTIVVSPLLSLMQDQVDHLRELKIQAFLYNGDMSNDERQIVLKGLNAQDVEKFVQLLYVTPEMLSKSKPLVSTFERLHQRKRLARIVIDEAHCVSQWGHDFRPDYKMLGAVRARLVGVPVMALTATATRLVQADVIHNLNIEGCDTFTQSFNRTNLTYEVRPKNKDVIQEIAAIVTNLYNGQTGIIYALSRKSCESIAEKLQNGYGVRAHHYHAGMPADERAKVQKEWQKGKYRVIVATIAFGMGIDKADVRYVIHHTIPKSLEGYYQETGRAGRDGKPSACYLFYGYRDSTMLKKMIDDGEGSQEQKERQRKMLRDVIQFCENKSDCRRVQVLAYFGESFNKEDCHATCDNCTSSVTFEDRDFTELAITALGLVDQLQHSKVTLVHCIDIFRGAKTRKIINEGHDRLEEHGAGQELDRGDVERLFYRLSAEDAISEYNVVNKAGFATSYVQLGKNAPDFLTGRRKLKIQCLTTTKGKQATITKSKHVRKTVEKQRPGQSMQDAQGDELSEDESYFERQNRNSAERGHLKLTALGYEADEFVVDDEAEEMGDELQTEGSNEVFDEQLGSPITDDPMKNLLGFHRELCLGFVEEATRICQKLRNNARLNRPLFSAAIFQQMAINFPATLSEMKGIPHISFQDVQKYGVHLLTLIKNTRLAYEANMGNEERVRRMTQVTDRHAANVIDLCEDVDEVLDDDFDIDERSQYFDRDPVTEAFNTQVAQASVTSRAEKPKRAPRALPGADKPSQGARKWTKKRFPTKANRAGGSRTSAGAADRDFAKAPKAKPSQRSFNQTSLIRAMPT